MIKFCECGCGEQVKRRFVKGHQWRKRAPEEPILAYIPTSIIVDESVPAKHIPPPYPAPFDHRLFRLAVEPPGTVMTDPWRAIPCSECKSECFTREKKAEYGTVICEDCLWRLTEEMGVGTQQMQNRTRGHYDPFQ